MSGLVLPTASTSRASSTGAPISLPGGSQTQQQGNKASVNGNGVNGGELSADDKGKAVAVQGGGAGDKEEIIPGVQGIVPTLQ